MNSIYNSLLTLTFTPIGIGREVAVFSLIQNPKYIAILRTPMTKDVLTQVTGPSILNDLVNNDERYNNVMIEKYESCSRKMKFHTDTSPDFVLNSCILIYCFYNFIPQNENEYRIIVLKHKKTKEIKKVVLKHGICFELTSTLNQEYEHKIVLNTKSKETGSVLILTYRQSLNVLLVN